MALTMHHYDGLAHELLQQGMLGYVVKDAAFDELVTAIKAVADGKLGWIVTIFLYRKG